MASVVITGSARGLGFGMAQEFLQRGHDVVLSDRSIEGLDAARVKLEGLGPATVLAHPCDVTVRDQVEALWDKAFARFGRVDYWINNAGVAETRHTFEEIPENLVHAMVNCNLIGTFNGSQVALRGMRRQGFGALYNVIGGPFRGKVLAPKMSVYGATKAGIFLITRYLTEENRDCPIIVGGLLPGVVATENVLDQARALPADEWAMRRDTMNILTDLVETTCPYLVDSMLKNRRSGRLIACSSTWKLARRFLASRIGLRRDVYSRFGL